MPVYLYGIGNGADKILDMKLPVSGIFASDEFARGNIFRGFRVERLAEIETRHDKFAVVLAFASNRPEVTERIRAIDLRHTLFVPNFPVYGDGYFDSSYYSMNKDKINAARNLFADDESRRLFDAVIEFNLTGRLDCLNGHDTHKERELTRIPEPFAYIDAGAYNGDTIRELCEYKRPVQIIAIEPDARNYRKLTEAYPEITAINAAVRDSIGTIAFASTTGRGASASGKKHITEIPTVTIDSIAANIDEPLYIKYDVEGDEREAIIGSSETIRKKRPMLTVSLYHRLGDFVTLPLMINAMRPDYNMYLRKHPYIPCWDLNLYCY